jgi:metal-responsive CopG/Arc/MetJ family transcriptional regulator
MKYTALRLPEIIIQKIDKNAKKNGITRSEQIRQILIQIYGDKNGSEKQN